jgi:hypothetical protein
MVRHGRLQARHVQRLVLRPIALLAMPCAVPALPSVAHDQPSWGHNMVLRATVAGRRWVRR